VWPRFSRLGRPWSNVRACSHLVAWQDLSLILQKLAIRQPPCKPLPWQSFPKYSLDPLGLFGQLRAHFRIIMGKPIDAQFIQ
jgi:hypothetical protein